MIHCQSPKATVLLLGATGVVTEHLFVRKVIH